MRLSQTNNYSVQQPKTNKPAYNKNDPFPPWAHREFTLIPSREELAEERDGAFLRRETVVRFISKPFAFGEVWKNRRVFRSTKGHPGFDGRDVYQTVIDANLKPLNDKKRSGEKVTSEEWKAAFNTTPLYDQKHAFELIDFQWYHFQKVSDNKAALALHLDRNCPLCKSSDPYVAQKRFGGRKYWAMKKSEFSAFTSEDSKLGIYAVDVDGNVIECEQGKHLIGMQCRNCGHDQISQQDLTGAPDQQVMQWTDNAHTCNGCGQQGYLKDVLVDGVVRRLSYKDVAWKVEWSATKMTRNGKPSISNSRVIFTPMITDKLSELVDAGDFGPLPEEISAPEWGQTPDSLGVPYDLADCYRPEPRSAVNNEAIRPRDFADREDYVQAVLESQAAALGIENPYRPDDNSGDTDGFDTIPF